MILPVVFEILSLMFTETLDFFASCSKQEFITVYGEFRTILYPVKNEPVKSYGIVQMTR